jgi:hypothetical protein
MIMNIMIMCMYINLSLYTYMNIRDTPNGVIWWDLFSTDTQQSDWRYINMDMNTMILNIDMYIDMYV